MAEQPKNKRKVHWAIMVIVYFHLFMVVSWTLPHPPARVMRKDAHFSLKDAPNYLLKYNDKEIKSSFLAYYMGSTGFWQYWDMFSPNPATRDSWLDAIVEYKDGTKMVYKYPRMYDMSIFEKYFKERYRKFAENAIPDKDSYKWPAIARRVAYLSDKDDTNPPVKVTLRVHYVDVLPMGQKTPEDYTVVPFFVYRVDTERLYRQVHG
ncbi:MAG TPA: hypothetical protein VNI20_05965 [Fimbriimonadaceae bacterium]|nr:hypothetical protein [Fimbriimonadaceae bacterium]